VTREADYDTPAETDQGIEPGPAKRWRPRPRALDPTLVLRLAGHRPPAPATAPIRDAARRMAEHAAALVAIEAWWRAVRVSEASETGVRLEGSSRFSGRAVGAHLAGCRLAVAFVLTIGPALEAEVTALDQAREPLDALFLDTAGWGAIEDAVRRLRLDLRARARLQGGRLSHRLAPGYADWPLQEQSTLLRLLGPGPLPVRLTEHGVLVPFKSITGLFSLRTGGTREA